MFWDIDLSAHIQSLQLDPAQSIRVLRVLCREEFSVAAARTFVEDLKRAMQWLTGHFMYTPEQVSCRQDFVFKHICFVEGSLGAVFVM